MNKQRMDMDFDAVAYLNEPRWQQSRLGLERIAVLLEGLGNPQDRLRTVHVAGTNGKGSTCAFISSVLRAAGYRTAQFTSPYVTEFADRIRIDGENIPAGSLQAITLEVKAVADTMADHPTEFELMTAVAFLYFASAGCDIAVIEVGMGGRLDSTNIISKPELSVITHIGLDHVDQLGETIAAIAREKAGIIKPGVPVVTCQQPEQAQAVIEEVAEGRGAPLTAVQGARLSSRRETHGQMQTFDYKQYQGLELALLGTFQPENAALAIEAIECLREKGFDIPDSALYQGLAEASWPGRFERIGEAPSFIVDGAHNPSAARELAASLEKWYGQAKVVFIIGVLKDKGSAEMLREVVGLARAFVVIEPPNERALPAEQLAELIREEGARAGGQTPAWADPYIAASIEDAVFSAQKTAGKEGVVCAFGSLYTIAALKKAYEEIVV